MADSARIPFEPYNIYKLLRTNAIIQERQKRPHVADVQRGPQQFIGSKKN
jgi:hypothetical protein